MHKPSSITVKASVLAGMAVLMLAMHACSARKAEVAVAEAPPMIAEPVRILVGEPPKTSELAMMMREMVIFTDSTGKRLLADQDLLPFPESFLGLRTAEPTPNMVDEKNFDPYAQAWLFHLNKLYTVPTAERIGVFNTLVQTCAACHTTMCPGPLVRINKMKLPENGD